uniref:Membrane protein n=1 Tax=Babesia bovis TaxID=5865 RepID=S6BKC8_BABBO|nr:membrane protein [Babesia bovis]
MDTTTCTSIVLVLLWLSFCCQALGSLVILLEDYNSAMLPTTTAISTVLLGVCLWQCKKAGYLVSPMTWYHWVLLVLLVLLQVVAVEMEYLGLHAQSGESYVADWTYPIYGIAAVLLCILGGTLFCGWKCNLFCRPCCKSQYICYGSAIVVVLVLLVVMGVTASLGKYRGLRYNTIGDGNIEKAIIQRLSNMSVPISQCYAMALLWITIFRLPYTVPEVVALLASVLAVASMLALGVLSSTLANQSTRAYSLLTVHILSLGITCYLLEYKKIFHWPKDNMCFGLLAAVVIQVALIAIVIEITNDNGYSDDVDGLKYTLLGYSFLLMVPTLWYAYRCGLFNWCLPKKKGLKATDTAENTIPDTDIAKES